MTPLKLFYAMAHRGDPSQRTDENWGNFGDELSPLVLSHVTGRDVEYADPRSCEIIAIGSLLDKFSLYRLTQILQYQRWWPSKLQVWGSGFMLPDTRMKRGGLTVHAVRGPLSQKNLPAKFRNEDIAFGDPGIFANELLTEMPEKKWKAGILPHYVDRDHPGVRALVESNPDFHLINIWAHPKRVLADIAACEVLFSSSLHGLIAADSLGVPNRWLKLSQKVGGGDFKFRDYCAGVDKPAPEPIHLDQDTIDERLMADTIEDFQPGELNAAKERLRAAAAKL
ncbi:polysaccharide pyruvyl transferase family protein [Roseibacillus persicicus]|uniref:polysaccharide pyruvyl transferase family protein n=1 Tax=Roseibacillus persicicus TaxID=454148 RepID=UPI00280E120E|nr:polysaccharide pyruvyl transferase family protein [Roseibacillus persicicus]MDQ8192078.1 polysaccharide pyruvyl transferase family protein [Roseibacillus persicicus]